MTPRPSATNRADQAHANTVSLRQHAARSVTSRSLQYRHRLHLAQFGAIRVLPPGDNLWPHSLWVQIATQNEMRLEPGPVGVTPLDYLRMQRRSRTLASCGAAMTFAVVGVLLGRRPIEVGGRIVRSVAIAMRAMLFVGWARAVERGAHELVGGSIDFTSRDAQRERGIATAIDRGLQQAPRVLALPVGNVATNFARIRDRIIGRFGDLSPFHAIRRSIAGLQYQGSNA